MSNWQFVNLESLGRNEGPGNRQDILAVFNCLPTQQAGKKQKILDVGCNTAWLAHFFSDYYGLDVDFRGINLARDFWIQEGRWSKEEACQRLVHVCQLVGAKIIYSGYESVAPGTQKIARVFKGRSPLIIRLLSHFRFWPRNAVTLMQVQRDQKM
ncbi:hypothetical protein EBR03_03010 [bacterium]|nr:hypothetical protein [bacterium]